MPRLVASVVAAGAMAGCAQPTLTVDELSLRPWRDTDVDALVAAYQDLAIRRWHTRTLTPAEAAGFVTASQRGWTQETGASWAVTDAATGVVLGRSSLRDVDLAEGLAAIAYWVVPAGRGRGVAARALRTVTDWALDELGLHRLELEHSTRNAASCRVADRAGYPLESTRTSRAKHEDGWHDMHLHVRLAG